MSMRAIALSPVDYLFTGVGSQPITFAFFYPHKLGPAALRNGLAKTLEFFPLLQSKLIKSNENELEYHFSKHGLTFDVNESNNPVENVNIDWPDGTVRLLQSTNKPTYQFLIYLDQ